MSLIVCIATPKKQKKKKNQLRRLIWAESDVGGVGVKCGCTSTRQDKHHR